MTPGPDMRDVALRPTVEASGGGDTVTIDAMPYERTVTCGSYTVTGDYTGALPSWTASPSGASGSCSDTGGGGFSCVVDVDPDAVGEGVETITIGTETVTIGFYVDGEHSCFLSQSVNGSYNSGLSDLDAVATWENLGSSALDVTQGTGSAQPTFRTSIVGGNPVVRCDGGDRVAAATASDWTFLHNGTDWTFEHLTNPSLANPNAYYIVAATTNTATGTSTGLTVWGDDRAATPANQKANVLVANAGGSAPISFASADNAWPAQVFSLISGTLDDDGGAGVDFTETCNGSACGTATKGPAYAAGSPNSALVICALPGGTQGLTGDLFRILIYQSALTATQRGINKAVDEWALGGTLPVTP
jgi:hypothetical protein